MPQADALRVMKMYGEPSADGAFWEHSTGDVYIWNLDKTARLMMVFEDYKLKAYEGSITEKNTRKFFATFYNLLMG